ncbi:unnamed protein product (macronuclear) [Paramecium tetraurelia]|uniref:Uncharacterized protein n=1 Tax=Paramecium tetraurelia TaxID=5888 RepID=A0CM59_PARTE|nr:uncharacterized protein GSPATT00008355001 [Paramecium tetraurelia]CAK71876.1 unnamed protein product [Paramecium tetraurelia]|eukprot:XP_001439273.1 hypothetical protein (macronuclear) [Paramecium tetraurelia strain d4-2]
MKTQLQRGSYGELSSIRSYPTEKLNTQSDSELIEVDMEKLNFHSYYLASDPIQLQSIQVEGELYIKDFMKKLIAIVSKKITENEQIKMLPIIGYQSSIDRMSHPIQQYFRQHEDPTFDYLTGGLEEDEEPVRFQQEQWLVQKINSLPAKLLEVEQQSTNSNRQSLTAQTFMRSRVLIQDQAQLNNQKNVKDKEKLPGIVDLNDPLDISATEELLRAQKERDYKVKQDLKEQERKRRQKELEEQQLKYDLISKDKKSKLYTYDYDGKLISVVTLKGHKFPPTAATLGSKFEDGQTKLSMFNKRKTVFQNSGSQIKKKQEDEKDKDTKEQIKFQSLAPLVNENMHLQQGVLMIQEGRVREGPKDQPISLEKMSDPALRMVRNEYLSLTQQINASHNQSSAQLVKAEDAQIKDFTNDHDQKQILNRIRRLSQPSITSDGNIKINSMQIYEQVAQVIFDDKEQYPISTAKLNNNNTKDVRMMRSPTDQYNISLYKNTAWGKEVPSTQSNTTKLKGNKASAKDILSTVGVVVKRTRERRGNSETTHLPKMKNISQF